MTTKETLHRLVDELPDDGEKLDALHDVIVDHVQRWEALGAGDRLRQALASAPPEDEELSPEESEALARAWARFQRRDATYTADEDVARELGE